jgi:hypothetical protein
MLTCAGSASAAAQTVNVFPSPGTHAALPGTQIAIRGIGPGAIGSIQVIGSRTGAHAGAFAPDSDDKGASFIPSAPFAPGETVSVSTGLTVLGATRGAYQFTVAQPAGQIPPGPVALVPAGAHGIQHFRSRPDLLPPSLTVTRASRAAAPGDIFVAPQFGPAQDGPMLFDPAGNLIWFKALPKGTVATDFRVQRYGGAPVLTWWQGYLNHGLGVGTDVIDDGEYRQIATVGPADGLRADLHEFQLTPSGTALIIAASPVYADLSSVHGAKRAVVIDSVIQEIDIRTGLLLFEWHSLDHVALNESYVPPPKVNNHLFDFFHANSVGMDRDHNLVISARNTSAAYKVNHQTGAVMWRLGGKRSSFRMQSGTKFAFQHDVRVQGDGTISLFDDGAQPPVHKQSRALRLHLNYARMTASWLGEDEHSPPLLAGFEGNQQALPNGDAFVGWGQQPYFTEFDAHGRTLFDAHFLAPSASYRAYRFAWSAQPATPPAVAATARGATASVYASWNGATTVVSWRVLAGSSSGSLSVAGTAGRHGFETTISVHSGGPYFAVQALDGAGRVLSTSNTVRASG